MPWPAIAAIAGSLIGAAATRNANRENRLAQERFASEGIQMRVADAKAAGVHPLFALGASTPQYSPTAEPIFQSQDVTRALTQFTPEERAVRAASLEAIKAGAAKDYALAAAADAEAARARQELNQSAPVASAFPVPDPGGANTGWEMSYNGGPYESVTMATQPRDAAPHPYLTNPNGPASPGFKRWGVPAVGEVILPEGDNMADSLEGLESMYTAGAVVAANLAHYGPERFKVISRWLQRKADEVSARASDAMRRAISGALGLK